MQVRKSITGSIAMTVVLCFMVSGCAVNFYKHNPRSKKTIQELETKISDLEAERQREREHFAEVQRMLEQKLKEQISDESISLRMGEGGLAIVVSDDILFDSGKAEIKNSSKPVLDKVASVIKSEVPTKSIGVTGHTDNVPITHSGWKSNWELSTARATNVLHYLESQGVSPSKLSATGYGEHRPIASNSTAQGRSKNRRVEIVILPEFEEKRESFIK